MDSGTVVRRGTDEIVAAWNAKPAAPHRTHDADLRTTDGRVV
jgi:hypothetical protein